jgi:hypothetical protein
LYFYFDPIDRLPALAQARWRDPAQQALMLEEARAAALRHSH